MGTRVLLISPLLVSLLFVLGSLQAQPPVTGEPQVLASLRYIDIAQGTGAPAGPGQRYTVHYTGWLRDGTKFDSSVDRNEPLKFVQGRRQVIAGWDTGFEGMKVGGKRRLLIPYQLAYGEAGSGPIPPKAELIFDVELLAVEDVPVTAPGIDVLVPFVDLETRVMSLARAIPAERYSWKPNDQERSVGEVFARIADITLVLQGLAGDDIKPSDVEKSLIAKAVTASTDKSAILTLLATNFAGVRKDMEAARNGFLSGEAEIFGKVTTHRGIFVLLDTAIAEQLGRAIAYARAFGVMLPWTAGELR